MKFSLPKEAFLEELQILQGIVEKRNTMPILANVLMNVSATDIELTGTDLEVGLRTHIGADIEKTGAITVNGKKIFEIVKSLPEGETVHVELKDETLEIKAGASEFKVLCLAKEDYPQVPDAKFDRGIALPLQDLKDMIDRVFYAITQEQRYYLNGALMSLKNRQIELVSTDGHRLSYTKKAQDGLKLDKDMSVIVAKKTLNEIRKFEDETVAFDLDESNLFFKVGARTLISRIIESKFPNYQAVIPKDNPGPADGRRGPSWPTRSGACRSCRPSGPRGSSSPSRRTACASSPRTRRSARRATAWPSNTRARTWRSGSTPSISSISSPRSSPRRSSSRSRTRTAPSCSSRRPRKP